MPSEKLADYFPLKAAPEYHKPVFENEFVLVLDVSIPPGATVPAHVHPWPAVFITLHPAHLVFRNLAAEVVRDVLPPIGPTTSRKWSGVSLIPSRLPSPTWGRPRCAPCGSNEVPCAMT